MRDRLRQPFAVLQTVLDGRRLRGHDQRALRPLRVLRRRVLRERPAALRARSELRHRDVSIARKPREGFARGAVGWAMTARPIVDRFVAELGVTLRAPPDWDESEV